MGNILIGWSEVNITPDKPIKLAGQFFDRISEYVETPITVTALAIKNDIEQAVFCSCDLVSISDKLIQDVRNIVKDANVGINVNKIIINATHTHTSHIYERGVTASTRSLDKYLPKGKKIDSFENADYFDPKYAAVFLSQKIAEAILKAWKNIKPSKLSNEFGRAVIGHCRRVCYDDYSAKMWGDADSANFTGLEGGNDSGIEMLYIFDTDKKLSGIVINVACPSQVVEHRSFISSDYWGKVKVLLREKYGNNLFVLCQCSSAGDQCPRDLIRWVEPNTPTNDPNIYRANPRKKKADCSMFDIEGTWELGHRIADVVIARYEAALKNAEDDFDFIHEYECLKLPLRKVGIKEYETAKKQLEEFFGRQKEDKQYSEVDRNSLHLPCGTIDRYEYQQKENIVPIELHIIKLGNIAFATNPFELFLNYGLKIKARSFAEQTFLLQLACGSLGYLPTEIAEKGSHYSAYVTSGYVGHEGGNLLVQETVDKINTLFKNNKNSS